MGKMGPMLLIGAAELPEPTGWATLGWLLVAAGALALVLNQLHDLWQRTKDKPSAAEVRDQANETFVTSDHCHTLHAEHERRITSLEAIRAEDLRSAAESRKLMYQKMDELRATVGADIRGVHKRVDDLSAEVRLVPGAVVRMISEAKNI